MRLYKKFWKKLKSKINPGSSFTVSSFDKAVIEEAYHIRQEYIKSNKFSDAVTNNLLEEELVDCFSFLKGHLKTVISPQDWQELESLPLREFVFVYTKKHLNEQMYNFEKKEQVSRAVKRIMQIETLKEEVKNNLDSESYYSLILNLYALKQVHGFLYISIKKMMKGSRDKMYEIARDTSLNINEAQKKIALEVAKIIQEEISFFKEDIKKQKSPLIVGVEVDHNDIQQALLEFGKIPVMLKPENLKKYVETVRS